MEHEHNPRPPKRWLTAEQLAANPGKYIRVNPEETGIEFTDDPPVTAEPVTVNMTFRINATDPLLPSFQITIGSEGDGFPFPVVIDDFTATARRGPTVISSYTLNNITIPPGTTESDASGEPDWTNYSNIAISPVTAHFDGVPHTLSDGDTIVHDGYLINVTLEEVLPYPKSFRITLQRDGVNDPSMLSLYEGDHENYSIVNNGDGTADCVAKNNLADPSDFMCRTLELPLIGNGELLDCYEVWDPVLDDIFEQLYTYDEIPGELKWHIDFIPTYQFEDIVFNFIAKPFVPTDFFLNCALDLTNPGDMYMTVSSVEDGEIFTSAATATASFPLVEGREYTVVIGGDDAVARFRSIYKNGGTIASDSYPDPGVYTVSFIATMGGNYNISAATQVP